MTCEDCTQLCAELDELREAFEACREDARAEREAYRENVLERRLDEVAATCNDARDDRVEPRETVARLQDRVQHLEARQEALVGVEHPAESNPAQLAIDLRAALIRRAKARTGKNARRAAFQSWFGFSPSCDRATAGRHRNPIEQLQIQ